MLSDAMDALVVMDLEQAKSVVASDPRLDALQRQVEQAPLLCLLNLFSQLRQRWRF